VTTLLILFLGALSFAFSVAALTPQYGFVVALFMCALAVLTARNALGSLGI
jgi:hypothetical protein